MISSRTVNFFVDLFSGRDDAHGSDEGPCVRSRPDWDGHLDGTASPIGIYPLVRVAGRLHVCWGCVDFDTKEKGKPSWDYETERDAHIAAWNLQRTLQQMGVTSYVERTRSRSGRHVWVFANEWVPAATMRRLLLLACAIAGVSNREVMPKSVELADDQLGNFVRLPYPGQDPDSRYMLDTHGNKIPLDAFVEDAHAHLNETELLERWAARYEPPPPPRPIDFQPYTGTVDGLLARLNGKGKAVVRDGPLNEDRSRALMYLAGQCAASDLTAAEALSILDDAAARWGKFAGRRDRMQQLQRIVERAYT